MSDECGDNSTPPVLTPTPCRKGCYWYSQGQCFLNTLHTEFILEILCQTPQAREDLLECVERGCCETPSLDIIEFAENAQNPPDEYEAAERFQRRYNTFVDNHRYIGPGVFDKGDVDE